MDVSTCILQHKDEILLLLRQDHKPYGNTWNLPGGKREDGEEILDTVKMEILEEINFNSNPSHFKTFYVRFPDFDFIYNVFHEEVSEKFVPNLNEEEHKDFQWITPEKALEINLIDDEAPCLKVFIESKNE